MEQYYELYCNNCGFAYKTNDEQHVKQVEKRVCPACAGCENCNKNNDEAVCASKCTRLTCR